MLGPDQYMLKRKSYLEISLPLSLTCETDTIKAILTNEISAHATDHTSKSTTRTVRDDLSKRSASIVEGILHGHAQRRPRKCTLEHPQCTIFAASKGCL